MSPPVLPSEPERLRALDRYAILDTPPEPAFDDLTTLAARLFNVPIALISVVGADHQWFKSRHGLEGVSGTPRDVAFCAWTILGHALVVVPDATKDERFADNPMVTGPPHVRFYVGAPLTTSEGYNLGDLCLADTVPRDFSEADAASLTRLAAVVMTAIESRRTEQRLRHEIDVHEQTARTLRLVEAKYRRIAEHSPGMVHQFVRHADGSGEFLFVSNACREILELEPATLQRHAGEYFQLVHPDDLPAYERAAAESLAHLDVLFWEGRYLAPSGKLKWVQLSSQPERMPDGATYWDGLLLDITARKQAQTDLLQAKRDAEQAQAEAERANRAKSEFLSRMSHELRTPLNAILGFGQLLELGTRDAPDALGVESILKAGRHLLMLVDEVLDLARVESGELHLRPGNVDVHGLAKECVTLVARLARARGITCKVKLPGRRRLMVWADAQRLRQTLLNFLSNAIKYNREGGQVLVNAERTPSGRLRLKVSDTGPGISPEGLARLFVPFERLDQASHGVEGTGLGLVVSRRIAEAMGGRVGVESRPGHGSVFWIELPMGDARMPSAPRTVPRAAETGRAPTAPARVTVLYIEDDVSNLEIVKMLLVSRRPGWRFLAARDGAKGLAMARKNPPDVILLDLQMPGISGDAVLAELLRDPATQAIPVIMLTADATSDSRQRLLASGAAGYLSKPFELERLLTLLDEVLREQ